MSGRTISPGVETFSTETMACLVDAERYCLRRGAQLTASRRWVLGVILEANRPLGAYEILEVLRKVLLRAAPPTVYRALDFLNSIGLVHRIERRAAYVSCTHQFSRDQDRNVGHRAQFLICNSCGDVQEVANAQVDHALHKTAARGRFAVSHMTVEIEGICFLCQSGDKL